MILRILLWDNLTIKIVDQMDSMINNLIIKVYSLTLLWLIVYINIRRDLRIRKIHWLSPRVRRKYWIKRNSTLINIIDMSVKSIKERILLLIVEEKLSVMGKLSLMCQAKKDWVTLEVVLT